MHGPELDALEQNAAATDACSGEEERMGCQEERVMMCNVEH